MVAVIPDSELENYLAAANGKVVLIISGGDGVAKGVGLKFARVG
jgi:hypothetical protein